MHSQPRLCPKSWIFLRVDHLLFSGISNLKFSSALKPWVCCGRSPRGRDRRVCLCPNHLSSGVYNLPAAKICPGLPCWQVCAALGDTCVGMSLVLVVLSILIKSPTLQRVLSQGWVFPLIPAFREKRLALLTLNIQWGPRSFSSHPCTLQSASKAQSPFDKAGQGSLPVKPHSWVGTSLPLQIPWVWDVPFPLMVYLSLA